MARMTGGEALVQSLYREGIRVVFGLPGVQLYGVMAALRDLIGGWLERFSTVDEALAVLTAARIPCAPVLTPHDVVAHPHLLAREAFPAVPHPSRGRVRVTASPFHWDGRPVHPAGPAPYRVGEHSWLVLSEVLGYDRERIEDLIRCGAVEAP